MLKVQIQIAMCSYFSFLFVTSSKYLLVIEVRPIENQIDNLDVIKTCDYIIDLGPEGGDKGGKIIAKGTPREVSQVEDSYTGQFLKKYFE